MTIDLTKETSCTTTSADLTRYGIIAANDDFYNNNSITFSETVPCEYRLYIKKYNNLVLQGKFKSYDISHNCVTYEWRDIPTVHEDEYTMNAFIQ